MTTAGQPDPAIRAALRLLEVDDLVLGIHDRSFPPDADDIGYGSPYSAAGREFLAFVRQRGFTGVQLGPQGETSAGNPSPYDGSLFSRSRLPLSLARLADEGLVARQTVAQLVAGRPPRPPDRIDHAYAEQAQQRALAEAYATFTTAGAEAARRLATFRRTHATWLERDALWAALCEEHGGSPAAWPALDARLWSPGGATLARRRQLETTRARTVERYAFEQLLAHGQHDELRAVARALGLSLWGDLQVGFSPRDAWAWRALFLDGYALGAPPSRTNPEGQPWGYPVLAPENPVVESFVTARLAKTFAEFDGVRIDHPHGWVCPWVYRTGTDDPLAAVQAGARLFASPDLSDHPALARFALVERAQLNPDPRTPRYADDWVVALTAEQVERYDRLMALVVRSAPAPAAVACEVLSTCPYPLARVLARHGLGRFRVTQKANLDDPQDVYRTENAAAADWVMVGTHDTRPLWLLLDDWAGADELRRRAAYLASRLAPEDQREDFARRLAGSPALLAQAQFADLLAGPARHVMVFFTDAFGLRAVYNQGGVVAGDNWTLRLTPDYREAYTARLRRGAALDLPRALATALRARPGRAPGDILARLDALAMT
jgi:4-alpha-glucanotransferase